MVWDSPRAKCQPNSSVKRFLGPILGCCYEYMLSCFIFCGGIFLGYCCGEKFSDACFYNAYDRDDDDDDETPVMLRTRSMAMSANSNRQQPTAWMYELIERSKLQGNNDMARAEYLGLAIDDVLDDMIDGPDMDFAEMNALELDDRLDNII
jgi:hypothetical protein